MPHGASPITTVAAALALALVFGFLAVRLKLPALFGYLLAGVLLGPATPGFVGDLELTHQLSEVGVILIMFGVGLHFSFADLMAVRSIAVPGAVAQIAVATGLGIGVASLWGWSFGAGLVFGLCLSVASTVVLLRALEVRGQLSTMNGQIAVGWLVVEDIAMVVVLVVLPAVAGLLGGQAPVAPAGSGDLARSLVWTLGKIVTFVALMLVVGRRVFPWLLWQVARTGSRELFVLCVIATALGIAFGAAQLFGISHALGAFFAGMVMRGSALSYRAAEESLPLRDAFAVLFFVAVGMLFEPQVLMREPLRVLLVVAIIVVGKSLAAFGLVLAFRYPLNTALTVSASLAQVGEFSFILVALGVSLGLVPIEARSLVLAGALISIALNPFLFQAVEPVQAWIRKRSRLARAMERPDDPLAELPTTVESNLLSKHVVLVGHGRVGKRILMALEEKGVSVVVAEQTREIVEELRERGTPAVFGDASEPAVLIQAHIVRARMLVVAVPDPFRARKMIEIARTLNPRVETVVRTHTDEDATRLEAEHAGKVFMGEHELALGMIRHTLERVAAETSAPASGHG
jgi:CPA2 family monovalent cation:H+ antiporter-2